MRVLARLQHPHILALLDSGLLPLTPGGERICPYYVMPFVRGESLRQRLTREGRLPLETVSAIASQVAGALDYAHTRGIVHRDVKPDNLHLSDEPRLPRRLRHRLGGGGRGGQPAPRAGKAIGTATYMSPEQAAAERDLDGRSDQYSLACVVYEMLAGEPPFTGPTAETVITQRLSGPPP